MNCEAFFCIFYVLFTVFMPFLILFSFPMKVSNLFLRIFYVLFTLFSSPFFLSNELSSFFCIFYVLFTLFSSPFFLSNELSSFFWHFLRTFYALYAFSSPFFLSNESVQPCPTFFDVLFTLFTPFLLLSFPVNCQAFFGIFYVLFTVFMPFLILFSFPMKVSNLFLRTFYAFYAFSSPFLSNELSSFFCFFYVLFTVFMPFLILFPFQ